MQWSARFIWFMLGCLVVGLIAACSEDEEVSPDTTPPALVDDLAATTSPDGSITLTWTAPGGNGENGTASAYDIRYWTKPPLAVIGWWDSATVMTNLPTPQPAGSNESLTVTLGPDDVEQAVAIYFVLKTSDGTNLSGVSNQTMVTAYTVARIHADQTSVGFYTIQAAIDAAVDGETVQLVWGTYEGVGNRDLDFGGKAITLRSRSGATNGATIKCDGRAGDPHRGIFIHSGESAGTIIEGLTFTGGFTESGNGGGAIRCDGPVTPIIRSCVFSSNSSSSRGGAINCTNGAAPTISDCQFRNNLSRDRGGAIACDLDAAPTIIDCLFDANQTLSATSRGGAIAVTATTLQLTGCTVSNNVSIRGGGLLCTGEVTVTISECEFTGNTTPQGSGAAIYCDAGASPLITDCILANNSAGISGGALLCMDGADPILTDCTLRANTAATSGGAAFITNAATAFVGNTIYNNVSDEGSALALAGSAAPTLERCILAYNGAGAAVTSDGATATFTCSNLYGNAGGNWVGGLEGQLGSAGNISQNPLFCDFANGIVTLRPTSPCGPGISGCGLMGAWEVGCE